MSYRPPRKEGTITFEYMPGSSWLTGDHLTRWSCECQGDWHSTWYAESYAFQDAAEHMDKRHKPDRPFTPEERATIRSWMNDPAYRKAWQEAAERSHAIRAGAQRYWDSLHGGVSFADHVARSGLVEPGVTVTLPVELARRLYDAVGVGAIPSLLSDDQDLVEEILESALREAAE